MFHMDARYSGAREDTWRHRVEPSSDRLRDVIRASCMPLFKLTRSGFLHAFRGGMKFDGSIDESAGECVLMRSMCTRL